MLDPPERPPIASAPLSVVLLAPPVPGKVEEAIGGWLTYLAGRSGADELLLVDEGSSAGSPALDASLASHHPQLRVLSPASRRGRGAALRVGLEAAQHPLVFCGVCDCQYLPAELALLLKWIDRVDLVCGYRVWPAGFRGRSLAEYAYRCLVRVIFGVRLRDVNCWFMLARRSIFARIPIQSSSDFALAEVLAKANHLGCLMTEAPVSYRPPTNAGSTSRRGPGRHWLAEACTILSYPDFGPAVLPEQAGASGR